MYKDGEVPHQPALDGNYWGNEEDKEFAQVLFQAFFTPRQRVIEETNGNLVGKFTGSPQPTLQGATVLK